ncbi:MAG: chemotaxis protein CheC [Candidatus Coatesbacteria bacterium]|nr:chemotaxis protein CheC [Candidatus Coatesbacteria bacterium]
MELNYKQIDALKEISNIGVGHAANSFSSLINKAVLISVTELNIVEYERLSEMFGDPNEIVTCILFNISGDLDAKVILLFPYKHALLLIDLMLGNKLGETTQLTPMGRSVIKEVANILTGSYLNPFQQMLGFSSKMTIPGMETDLAGAVLTTLDISDDMMSGNERIFFLKTKMDFSIKDKLEVFFLLIPKGNTVNNILHKLQIV